MSIVKGFLIVRADGEIRAVKRHPQLRWDEFAFPLSVTVPDIWGDVLRTHIDITLPEPTDPEVVIGEVQP